MAAETSRVSGALVWGGKEVVSSEGKGIGASEDDSLSFMWRGLDEIKGQDLLESLRLQGSIWIDNAPTVITDPIDTPELGQQQSNDFTRCASLRKCKLVEVFALVLLEDEQPRDIQCPKDDVFIVGSSEEYVLWENSNGKSNTEGYLILTGPDRGIEVGNSFQIQPHYCQDDSIRRKAIWIPPSLPHDPQSVNFFCSNYVQTRNGVMEVKFSVYGDAVEARLDISLSDLFLDSFIGGGKTFEVYGMVKASNIVSTHSEAKSVLFDHMTNEESIVLRTPDEGGDISLPLSRRVTVIPWDSTLIVDVNLYVHSGARDMCIANGRVLFSSRTRCNGLVEEMVIHGNSAKVRVRTVWVKDEESDKEESGQVDKEKVVEEDGGGEAEEVSNTAIEGSGHMEISGESYQDIPDDDGSIRSHKVRRLDGFEDVTSASEYSPTQPSSSEDEEQGASSLLELHSVQFLELEKFDATQIFGFILLETGNLHYIFRRVRGDPVTICPKGFVMLEALKSCTMSVAEYAALHPFMFNYEDFEFSGRGIPRTLLWEEQSGQFDNVLSKVVESQFGQLEVNYVVYRHGVQASLKVMLKNCLFPLADVYGSITATRHEANDPKALVTIFSKEEEDAVHVVVTRGETVIPLCRPIIALPYNSSLILDVRIHSLEKMILSSTFRFDTLVRGVHPMSIPGNDCSVEVIVDFNNNSDKCPLRRTLCNMPHRSLVIFVHFLILFFSSLMVFFGGNLLGSCWFF